MEKQIIISYSDFLQMKEQEETLKKIIENLEHSLKNKGSIFNWSVNDKNYYSINDNFQETSNKNKVLELQIKTLKEENYFVQENLSSYVRKYQSLQEEIDLYKGSIFYKIHKQIEKWI